MGNRAVAELILCLLFVSILTFAYHVQPVDAWTGTVHIRADGTVDPVSAPVQRNGNVYTLTGNITTGGGDGIIIERNNITLDGARNVVRGTSAYGFGVYLLDRSNVTVKNLDITSFFYGIYLEVSSNNKVLSNRLTNNMHGLMICCLSNDNTVTGNNMTSNYSGIYISSSEGNVLRSNRIMGSVYGFGVDSYLLALLINDVDASNTVDGKPIYYWVNKHDMIVPPDAGYVGLINCTRIVAQNLTLTHVGEGVFLAHTSNSTVTGNMITNDFYGVLLIIASSNNTIGENTITANEFGLLLYNSSGHNSIRGNSIAHNYYGVWFDTSSTNKFYHNSFNYNGLQVYDCSKDYPQVPPSINTWDDGYPSGGNYWSDYIGQDLYNGPNQNLPGSDGIGDTPYVLDSNNRDHYPIMIHSIAVVAIALSRTTARVGRTVTVNVTVENQGSYAESVNITLYANTTTIGTRFNIAINRREAKTISFTWNTTGFSDGRYTIKAVASPVQNEANTADNTLNAGPVLVINPDVTGDHRVNVLDLIKTSTSLGTHPGDPKWYSNADVNNDNLINVLDLILVANNLDS